MGCQETKNIFVDEDEIADRVWKKSILKRSNKNRHYNFRVFSKVAATLLILMAIAYFLVHEIGKNQEHDIFSSSVENVKTTPKGVKSTIRLPDGSTVILNAESTIKYSFSENDTIRILELLGEAYFKVKENPNKPFIVVSGEVFTEVLGTEFNVKAYREDQRINISLLEGKVKVKTPSTNREFNNFFLNPGEDLEFEKKSYTSKISNFNGPEKIGWKDGIIYFRKSNKDEIFAKLSRWYGIEFEFINFNNQQWEYSGDFRDEYLEIILEDMRYSEHFDYKFESNKVIITF